MFHVKHPEAATEPLAAATFVAAAPCAVAQRRPNGKKAFEFGISSCLFAAQESGALAKRLVVENHAPTSRMVRPYEAGTPSEFDAFLPFRAVFCTAKGVL